MTSAPAIGFEYQPSHWLPRLLSFVVLLALAAIALCGFPWWAKLSLVLVTLTIAAHDIRRAMHSAVSAAGWAPDGGWSLHWVDGSDSRARLQSFRVLGELVLLQLRAVDGRKTVLLLAPDNVDADLRRRLRMRLAIIAEASAPGD